MLVDPKSEREVTSPTTRATPSVPSTTRAMCRDSPPSPPRDGAPARFVSAARPFDATFVADACASAASPSACASAASPSATSSAAALPDARRRPARSPVALERVAAALRDAAAERWESGRRLDALAASMVALDALREARRVAVELVAEAEAEAAKARDAGNVEGERAARDEATSREKTASRVKTAFVAALRRAERAEAATRSAGAAGSAVMPSGARATREAAARLGRAGAAEELVGNLAPAAEAYRRAHTLFAYAAEERGWTLWRAKENDDDAEDRRRMARVAASLAARRAACAFPAGGDANGGEVRSFAGARAS